MEQQRNLVENDKSRIMNREERTLKNDLIKQNLEANLPGSKIKNGLLEITSLGKIEGEVLF